MKLTINYHIVIFIDNKTLYIKYLNFTYLRLGVLNRFESHKNILVNLVNILIRFRQIYQ